jgi:hypothetical protein
MLYRQHRLRDSSVAKDRLLRNDTSKINVIPSDRLTTRRLVESVSTAAAPFQTSAIEGREESL